MSFPHFVSNQSRSTLAQWNQGQASDYLFKKISQYSVVPNRPHLERHRECHAQQQAKFATDSVVYLQYCSPVYIIRLNGAIETYWLREIQPIKGRDSWAGVQALIKSHRNSDIPLWKSCM
jgi:hypothetical protein